MYKIGVIGSGFIAKGLINLLDKSENYEITAILTRTKIADRVDIRQKNLLTNSLEDLLKESELIVESTGDAIYATETIDLILQNNIPVVTMNSEFHVTTGSYYIDKGLVTEAEGDQPGSQAALREDVLAMGFKPLVYSNIKGFLNHNPTKEDMEYWGKKSGISLDMVTSFTDGTKVQIEQVFVANGFDLNIAQEGLLGLENDNMQDGGNDLANYAKKLGTPISDYLLSLKLPAGVFIVAEHDKEQQASLKYYKMGDGPYYVIERPFHLCHFEILKTVDRVLKGGGVLLDNGTNPKLSIATIAKRDIEAGEVVKKGIGSFDVRGIAIKIVNHPNHVPIGLMANVKFKKSVKAGELITFEHINLPDSLALRRWNELHRNVILGR